MKKIAVYILALLLFVTNVYADGTWFLLTPNIDSEGELVTKEKYDGVKKVEIKFKIVEIIEEIIS
ncbi:MAG: hypothetical protein ACI4VF_04250 [Lachnospirales bacterium]